MHIKFLAARAYNFKAHRDLIVEFGDTTQITGDNAQGKSTVLEIPVWTLYGTSPLGSKLDPTPTYDFDHVLTELLLDVDGKQILLGRGIEKKKTTYYINEVPSKATEFDSLVTSLFDRELFLSLFNPDFFFTLHWEKQRDLLMRFVTAPAAKEVFAEMSRTGSDQKLKDIELNPSATRLQELTKKHTLLQLGDLNRKVKNDKDTAHKRAQGKVQALREQLDKLPPSPDNIEAVQVQDAALLEQIRDIQSRIELADEPRRKRDVLQSTIDQLQRRIEQAKDAYMLIYNESIDDHCPTCKQALAVDAVKAVQDDHQRRKDKARKAHSELVTERKALEAQLAQIEIPDVSELQQQRNELEQQRGQTADAVSAHNRRKGLVIDLTAAQDEEQQTLKDRNDAIFVLDAIKAYEAKAAELQAAKVQDLFTTLSVSLFKQQSNGEQKVHFEIQQDNKPYHGLSLSERIKAGLELREVLSQQSGVIAPVGVDNSESIFKINKPSGQLILVKAVEDQPLQITEVTS